MASGSELSADVFVTGRDSLVSGGSVGTAGIICNVLGKSCAAEDEDDDVDTFSSRHRCRWTRPFVGMFVCPRKR